MKIDPSCRPVLLSAEASRFSAGKNVSVSYECESSEPHDFARMRTLFTGRDPATCRAAIAPVVL